MKNPSVKIVHTVSTASVIKLSLAVALYKVFTDAIPPVVNSIVTWVEDQPKDSDGEKFPTDDPPAEPEAPSGG